MADKAELLRQKKREIDEQARKRKAQIDAQLKLIEAAQSKKTRQLDNKKKLLEGVALRSWVARGKMSQDEYRQLLDEGLTLDRDRQLFGLPLLGSSPTEQAPAAPVPPGAASSPPQPPEKPQESPQKPQETPGKSREGRTYLRTEYNDRHQVKALGAWWDKVKEAWFVPAGKDLKPFERWLPQVEPASPAPGVPTEATTETADKQSRTPSHSRAKTAPAAPSLKPAAPAAAVERRKEERRKRSNGPPNGVERRSGERRKVEGKDGVYTNKAGASSPGHGEPRSGEPVSPQG